MKNYHWRTGNEVLEFVLGNQAHCLLCMPRCFTENQCDVSAKVKGDLETSGIVELNDTTDVGMTLPQTDFPAHSHAAPSSPLPDTTPIIWL